MKKILAIVSLALVIATLACLLSSCGAAKLKGTWSYEMYGTKVSYTFKSGGKGEFKAESSYGGGQTQEFKYKVSGKKLKITVDGQTETYDFKVKGKELTLTKDGQSLTLQKQK